MSRSLACLACARGWFVLESDSKKKGDSHFVETRVLGEWTIFGKFQPPSPLSGPHGLSMSPSLGILGIYVGLR